MNRVRSIFEIDKIHGFGYTGKNIGICILDTGVYPHSDLSNRIVKFVDLINNRAYLYDDNGHGTHVSGIVGSSGIKSRGKYKGIAVNSNIIVFKCLDKKGNGKVKNVVKAFEYIKKYRNKYNIKIINISIGSVMQYNDKENEILLAEVEEMWNLGFVVVAAAGNNGPKNGSITAPGSAKSIITVGASDDSNKSINVFNYSGRGPTTKCIVKPEIICPGTEIISCNTNNSYSSKTGTSMSTPVVSGIIGLLLERYPDMTNKDIKKKIHDTSVNLGYSLNHQGWGMINATGLLDLK